MRVLILGGTTEGSALAQALAGRRAFDPVLSLAGRTAGPVLPKIPHRIGGFGGTDGLAAYLKTESVDAVVDATHPFAERISAHAALAAERTGVPLARFTRPPWRPRPGDLWTPVASLAAAAAALGDDPRRVLLTVGRLGLAAFRDAPQHHYLIRTIDPPHPADLPPYHVLLQARGPFDLVDEKALLRREDIAVLVTKNSGGAAAQAKLDAARALGVAVVIVERPVSPCGVTEFGTAEAVIAWLERHRGGSRP